MAIMHFYIIQMTVYNALEPDKTALLQIILISCASIAIYKLLISSSAEW